MYTNWPFTTKHALAHPFVCLSSAEVLQRATPRTTGGREPDQLQTSAQAGKAKSTGEVKCFSK